MKKIKFAAVMTVALFATSFVGHAQTSSASLSKKKAAPTQTIKPATTVTPAQSKPVSSTSTASTEKQKSTKPATTTHVHKKINATAKPAPATTKKAGVKDANHFARRYDAHKIVLNGKHKKAHHKKGAKAPSGSGTGK